MKQYLTRDNLCIVIAMVLAVHMVSFPFIEYPYVVNEGPSWLGLDVSWQMTLNYARVMKWVWGKDIIYTYGPLGYLGTRLGFGISRWAFLLFDLFLVANMFCVFRDFIKNATDKWLAVIILFVCTLAVEPSHRSNCSWVLTLFSFYWMYRSYKEPKLLYFILTGINIVICFYMKLNAGLVGIALLIMHLVNLLVYRRIKVSKAVLVLSLLAVSIGVTAWYMKVSLPEYFKGASEIVKGYNDIMFIEGDYYPLQEINVSILFYVLLSFMAIYTFALLWTRCFSQVFFSVICFLYIFMLRKQGVIRNDFGHYFEFFSYVPLALLVGNFLHPFTERQKPILVFILLVSLLSLFYTTERPERTIDHSVQRRYSGQADYVHQFAHYNDVNFLNNRHKRYIPERILRQIGKHTVDIFPWDAEYLLENGLNYKPRPVFQSFVAYTGYLQQVNYAAYLKNAPDYIIYDYESIDERYPFNDDILVNFFICKNYTVADSFTSNGRWRTLLKKKQETAPIDLVRPGDTVAHLNEDIPVKWTMMMQLDVNYTLWGKAQSVLYRSPVLRIRMTRGNGAIVTYRISREMLKAGVMVDRWVNNNVGFTQYIQNKDSLDIIKSIRITGDTDFYHKDIKVHYVNVK